jgi:hypothetical protein
MQVQSAGGQHPAISSLRSAISSKGAPVPEAASTSTALNLTTTPTTTSNQPSPPDAAGLARFYLTSDLRAATGLTRTHLDFYLREGLIVPTARTESGYLLFDDGELATLRRVIAWRQDGLGLREIRARLGRNEDEPR